jgi:hypothetical protein
MVGLLLLARHSEKVSGPNETIGAEVAPRRSVLASYVITSLLQIFTQLHSFEYGTRLIRYPDFTPVTT